MRGFVILLFVLLSVTSFSQIDSSKTSPNLDRIRPALGVNALAGSGGGLAFSGHLFLRYHVVELGVLAGQKNRTIQNFVGYDNMSTNGYWVEPRLALIVPVYGKMSVPSSNFLERGYNKIKIGYGFVETDIEFTEEFTSTGPFQSYIYTEKYDNVKYRYLSVAAGMHADIENRVSIGLGLSYCNFHSVLESSQSHPIATPLNGKSEWGIYGEVTFLF